jgi:hypothetical protein
MYTQRKRAAAREAAAADAEESGTPVEAADGPTDPEVPVGPGDEESGHRSGAHAPEQPGDPASDTAAESADPSGTGERVDR